MRDFWKTKQLDDYESNGTEYWNPTNDFSYNVQFDVGVLICIRIRVRIRICVGIGICIPIPADADIS